MSILESKREKVYLWLRTYIDENKFGNHLKLPSENALSSRMEVSRETVRSALGRLENEGLIIKIKGSGTFINKEVALTMDMGKSHGGLKIGLIMQGQDADANSSLIQGIREVLAEDKVDLRIFLTDNKFVNERRCLQTVMHQDFNGFIVDGVKASLLNPNLDCYQQLSNKKIPVIFYNNYYQNFHYPHVVVNDNYCAQRLLSILIRKGHRKIAGIFNYDNYQSIEKFHGMMTAMRRFDVEFQDDYVKWYFSNDALEAKFPKVLEKFIKGLPQCTSIVCCNYMIYRIVEDLLRENGKNIPDDYSIVCLDYSGKDWEEVQVSGSIHQGKIIGREVAGRLLKMIENKEVQGNIYSCVLSPLICEGRTIKDLKKGN